MAGDYATAEDHRAALSQCRRLDRQPRRNHRCQACSPVSLKIPHPENFYSYHDDLMDQQVLDKLRSDVPSIESARITGAYLSNLGVTSVVDGPAFNAAIAAGGAALAAISAWQNANRHAANREFRTAMQSYEECQSSVADYCAASISASLPGDTATQRIQAFLIRMQHEDTYSAFVGSSPRWRRILLSLAEEAAADNAALHAAVTSAPRQANRLNLSTSAGRCGRMVRYRNRCLAMRSRWAKAIATGNPGDVISGGVGIVDTRAAAFR